MTILLYPLSSRANKTVPVSKCCRSGLQIWSTSRSNTRDSLVWPRSGLILQAQALATPHPCLDESQGAPKFLLPFFQSLGFQMAQRDGWGAGLHAMQCAESCKDVLVPRSLSPYQPIAKSASGRTASHLFLLGPSMLPPLILPNLSRFLKQFQLNGFSISLIKSAPARSAAHPCKQEFPAGQLLSEKKKSLDFLLENDQLKTELCGLVANIFLFISSRIWSRRSPSP